MEKFINEASFWVPESLVVSAWLEHAPFAFWLTDVHRPKLIVELGTHLGFSYFVFAQAVKRLQIKSRCIAVDTWKGDEHAGTYGDEVFEQVRAYNQAKYSDFSELNRSTFDEAVDSFEDGSIDLLHIDGRHFYQDVKHDFETWQRKLSNRAVVLFHDTNVRVRGFGVDRLWDEVRAQYPSFEFLAGHGLGVLGVGADLPQVLRDLFSLSDQPEARERLLHAYERLGAAVVDRADLVRTAAAPALDPRAEEAHRQLAAIWDQLKADWDHLNAEHNQLKAEHDQLNGTYNRLRNEHLELHGRYGEMEEQLKRRDQECSRLQAEVIEIEKLGEDARQAERSQFQKQLDESAGRLAELTAALGGREQELRNSQSATAEALNERDRKERELEARSAEMNRLLSSRSWRLTAPLRGVSEKAPGLRNSFTNMLKLFWWIVSLQLPGRLETRRYQRLIESSRLFDRHYYQTSNPDVAASGAEPVMHYLVRGAREKRNPHPLFDSAWYEKQNPDVVASGVNPLVHYLLQGWKEDRAPNSLFDLDYYFRGENEQARHSGPAAKHYIDTGWKAGLNPHPLFDGAWYLEQNPDVLKAGINPLAHYLDRGWKEKRSPHPLLDAHWYSEQLGAEEKDTVVPPVHYRNHGWKAGLTPHPLFDVAFYLEQNPDVAAAGIDPLEHYLSKGWLEARDPHPLFDTDWYLAQYPDVEEARINPLVHYATHGAKESRNPHPLFDSAFYERQHPELRTDQVGALEHFLRQGGIGTGDPHPLFNVDWYLKQYPDVVESGVNPLIHFVRHGWKEGRNPNPSSDSSWYLRQGAGEGSALSPLVQYLSTARETTRNGSHVGAAVLNRRRRILFVSGEPQTPGHIYRVTNIAESLPARLFDVEVLNGDEAQERVRQLDRTDILWIWRADWSTKLGEVITFAKRAGAKIVFDIDDLMFRPELAKTEIIDGIRSQNLTEEQVRRHYSSVQMTLGVADYGSAPTSVLASELRAFFKPTAVIPNGFNQQTLQTSKLAVLARESAKEDGLFRIGYASGSRTHQRDLALVSKAIANVLAQYDSARLVLFKLTIDLDEFPELKARENQIEWRDLVSLQNLPYEYARFDVNLAPLEVGNPFCEAKSELKYFEAALVGVPTIASPTAPFQKAIRHGETGFLAATENEWISVMRQLLEDANLGRRIAAEARREVIWLYGPEHRQLLVSRFVNHLLASPLERTFSTLGTQTAIMDKPPIAALPESEVLFEFGRRGLSRVSVVIPLFNYEKYVSDALNSVLGQTVREIDVIVVDDRSTDESVSVAEHWLEEHANQFNYVALLRNMSNSKLGRTRNAAVDFSDTEFFLPLDPDNLLLPGCIEKLSNALDETGAAFAYPAIELFGDSTGEIGRLEFDPALFQCGNYIDAMAMVRKACWSAVGGYAPLDPPGWEDYDFWCQLVEKGFAGTRVNEVVARYRVHKSSMLYTTTDVPNNKLQVIRELNKRHPWLNLRVQNEYSPIHSDFANAHRTSQSELWSSNLNLLLPILRCPETGEPLILSEDETLVSRSGSRSWPVVNGRPVFTPEGSGVQIQSESHVSNPLPDEAIQLIRSCRGLVLNLSAGASAIRFDNVVELEYTIFKHTNVVGDVHRLPFQDEVFEAVVCMNAFEHYREPDLAMEEIRRVLRPGGRLFMHTAFLQPLHESPHHYYNCTEFGLRQWLRNLNVDEIRVSDNFNPIYGLSWLLSEMDFGFAQAGLMEAANVFRAGKVGEILSLWREPATRNSPIWSIFHQLPQDIQKQFAAGWQATATKQICVPPDPEFSPDGVVVSGGS